MKIKIFQDPYEPTINNWMAANPTYEIKFTNTSEAMTSNEFRTTTSKTLYVFYEENKSVEL
jgi:hypothetical protein